MDKIFWTDDFSVGVTALDNQHKKLVELINQLIDVSDVDSDNFKNILEQMFNYTKEHLLYEEQLMKEHGYPEFEHHKATHLLFNKQLSNFFFDTEMKEMESPEIVLSFLQDWLTNHILKEDMKYKSFFMEIGVR